MQTSADAKVRVRFVTTFDQFRIVDTPFVVPSKLGRSGLSEIVNHLLGNGDADNEDEEEVGRQPFDFMIGDRLVRISLNKFIALHRLNTEDTITVNYFPATSLADESERIEVPAWVGCICTKIANSQSIVAAGCYDGQVKIFNAQSLLASSNGKSSNDNDSFKAHDEPIRAVHCWKGPGNNDTLIATASKDQTVKCWNVQRSNQSTSGITASPLCTLANGHMSSVECLGRISLYADNRDNDILLSGDWSGTICGWNMTEVYSGSTQAPDTASKKKRKGNSSNAISAQYKPFFMIKVTFSSLIFRHSLFPLYPNTPIPPNPNPNPTPVPLSTYSLHFISTPRSTSHHTITSI